MFRNSKSANALENQEAEDGTVDRQSASGSYGENVASSALRWFRGPKKTEEPPSDDRHALNGAYRASDHDETVDLTDDLELAEPLDPTTFDEGAGDEGAGDEGAGDEGAGGDGDPGPKEELVGFAVDDSEPQVTNAASVPSFEFYDYEDDIDDFDDLGDLDGVTPPEPLEKTSILAEVDLDDISSPEDLDDSVTLPVDLDPTTIGPHAPGKVTTAADRPVIREPVIREKAETSQLARSDTVEWPEPVDLDPAMPSKREISTVEALSHQPIMDVPLEAPSKKEPLVAEPLTVEPEAAPIAPLDARLALQPIPELQTDSRPMLPSSSSDRDAAPASPAEKEGIDPPEMLLDEAVRHDMQFSGADGDDIERDVDDSGLMELGIDSLELDASDDDVMQAEDDHDVENLASNDDIGKLAQDIDDLAIAGLEDDSLELDAPGEADDRSGDDWHARLADVLGGLDDHEDSASLPEPETEKARPWLREIDEPSALRGHAARSPAAWSDEASPVLPLSKTLSRLAMSNEPEETLDASEEKDDDILVPPPLLAGVTARQKTSEGQPPSTLPADSADLSPEQLSYGIIANLPRLRRFAAVRIGDELVADRLVQSTIETALADPAALEPISDLGLALIMLSHRLRQDMLADPAAPIDMPEAARAFESAVCRGLAGADQFEIRQFARAINALDEDDRGLLVLVALENFSYDQIASILRMPTERIMARISGARMRLRQVLASDESGMTTRTSASDRPHAQEIEIHGYLDGELDGHHMADIDALVEYDDDAADRLLHYGIQGDLIRRLYAPLLNRPIPGPILDAVSTAARPARRGFRFGSRRALIAGAVVIALCGSAVWPYIAPALSNFVSDAMAISQVANDRQDRSGSAAGGNRFAGRWTTPRSTIGP
ncbi:MAG: RNA polymerase sigma factor [Geminicoccaceae bacterium]